MTQFSPELVDRVVAAIQDAASERRCQLELVAVAALEASCHAELVDALRWVLDSYDSETHEITHAAYLRAEAVAEAAHNQTTSMTTELVKALEWYANPEVYKPSSHGPAFDDRDLSFKAKSVLTKHGVQS